MPLERNNNPSVLESLKEGDVFSLSHKVQAPCFEENSFNEGDILEITNRAEKSSETGTTGISFRITKKDNSTQNHVMSLGIFISNFDNKLNQITPPKIVKEFTESTTQRVDNLIVNS